jgi:hypothetical protein
MPFLLSLPDLFEAQKVPFQSFPQIGFLGERAGRLLVGCRVCFMGSEVLILVEVGPIVTGSSKRMQLLNLSVS